MDRPVLTLGDYYQLLQKQGLLAPNTSFAGNLAHRVPAVSYDSRAVAPGGLFLCKGAAFRQEYLEQALGQGAAAYVSERVYDVSAPCIQVTDIRRAMGVIADAAWGHPSGQVKVVGLTGTKGKTTTAWFIKAILDHWRRGQHPVGLLSSILTDDGVTRAPAVLTTPEPLELQRHLFNAATAGCGYVVMECSSQALKYGRVIGVELEVGAFLNLGEDHISPKEHPTAEDYFQSKLKIFDHSKTAVVNLDSDRAGEIVAAAGKCETMSVYALDYARDLKRTGAGMTFTTPVAGNDETFSIPMLGDFNVSNALCAISVCALLGVPAEHIRPGLASARVPGRMELYQNAGKTVVVDYAHNGMAMEALLRAVGEHFPGKRICVVFGSVGDKALDRRESLGTAAGALADHIYLTEDDPGSEDVTAICREIGKYVRAQGKEYTIIPDRTQAIKEAIAAAGEDTVVVLAGKGAEQAQKRKNGPQVCPSDGMLAKKYLGLPLGEVL